MTDFENSCLWMDVVVDALWWGPPPAYERGGGPARGCLRFTDTRFQPRGRILVQSRRDKAAATKFFRRLLKGLAYVPRVLIIDKLPGDGAAKRDVLPSVEHRQHERLNNRAGNAHQPTRERERRMHRFRSPGHAQRFLAAYGPIAGHFRPRRHRLTAATWRAVTGVAVAA